MISRNAPVSSSPDLPRWYAAYTYPRHERVIAEQLESKGVESFLPTSTTASRWKDRTVRIHLPLFPSYVFARIELARRVAVLTVPGVIRILSANGVPIPIPDSEIDAVRRCINEGAKLEAHTFVTSGMRVRVRSGPFAGLEGIVTQGDGKYKVLVSITAIHQSIALELDRECLEPILPSTKFLSVA
jgi:transcription antitermination factor NusG